MLKKLLFKLTGQSDSSNDTSDTQSSESRETGERHVKSIEDGWVILKHPGGESAMTFSTKREAVDEARSVCKEKGLELYIYKQNGDQQRHHNYA